MPEKNTNMKNIFEEKDGFLLISHHNSDPDAICSSIVLKRYLQAKGKNVRIGVSKGVNKISKKILNKFDERVEVNPELRENEEIIILDTPSFEQLEPIELESRDFHLIDHHHSQDIMKKSSKHYVKTEGTSTCELIYEILKKLGYKFDRETSLLLMLGIIYDTGHLKHGNTKTFDTTSKLIDNTEMSYGEIASTLYMKTDISEKIARLKAANRMDIYRIGDHLIVFSEVGSFESSSANSLVKFSADIAIVGNKGKDEVRISGRCNKSIVKKVNLVTDVFKYISDIIDGSAGGHKSAASANGKKPEKLNEAFEEILKRLEDKLEGSAKKLN